MPSTYLVDHARDNVWCTPDQDFQVVIAPYRLSDYLGVRGSLIVEMGQDITMPDTTTKFHVFQIGNLHPSLVGLFPKAGHWAKASDHMNVQGMIIQIYDKFGVNLPRFETWFVILPDRTMMVAIADQGSRFDLSTQDIFIRFYSNAFYESSRSDGYPAIDSGIYLENPINDWGNLGGLRSSGTGGDVLTEGTRIKVRNDLMLVQARVTRLRALGVGQVLCYYNGNLVPDFNGAFYTAAVVKEGDWCEFVLDASMSEILTFKIADCPTFDSILDGLRKYLLHRPTDVIDQIQYKDDLDIYLTRQATDTRFEGRYYYQNTRKAVRQVTHQDWSLPVPFVMGYVQNVSGFNNASAWTVRVYTRQSGYARPLINEDNRINELYRLSPAKRSQALLGLDSTLPFWRADNLENAMYVELMGRQYSNFTVADVEKAYGYNAISKLVADSPIATVLEQGQQIAPLPAGLQVDATIYEYTSQGLLLGYYQTYGTTHYYARNSNCAFIEGRVGIGSASLSTNFGTAPYTLNSDYDYFFMKVAVWNGAITGEWLPAIKGVDYKITNGVVNWNLDSATWLCVIRNNHRFLAYHIDLDATDGLMIFSVQSEEANNYEPANRVEAVPYGKLDLWLNYRPLIENIDYVVRWPQVVICNKEFIAKALTQRVDIRCTGLPQVDANGAFFRQLPLDVGFVSHGQLSRNNRYNVREDKVQRIVVRGSVKRPADVSYPEDGIGLSVNGITNGDPYAIEEVIVPIGLFTADGTYPSRAASMTRDRQIEDYVSQYVKDPVEENANPIPQRYDLFSPFIAKIIRDLQHGYLVVKNADVPLSNNRVKEMLADYLYLLDYDPSRLELDDAYVVIHPHDSYEIQTLGVYQYYLVEKAILLYMGGNIDTSRFLAIDTNWVPIPVAS